MPSSLVVADESGRGLSCDRGGIVVDMADESTNLQLAAAGDDLKAVVEQDGQGKVSFTPRIKFRVAESR